MPQIASWQTGQQVWSPDVKHLPSGRFLLYYADGIVLRPETHCVGAAVADEAIGPCEPISEPLICSTGGGAIDPAGFLDRSTGRRYILFKVDGNSLGLGGSCKNDILPQKPTPIMIQEVDPEDGVTLIGESTQLLDRSDLDGPLIEAPSMYRSTEGVYFLFFASNCYTTDLYATSYATADNILGPYTRASKPLLFTGLYPGLIGPGGLDIMHKSYAEIFEGREEGEDTGEDSRLVVFHSHMNRPQASMNTNQAPLAVVQPLNRGMHIAVARFKHHTVQISADVSNVHQSERSDERVHKTGEYAKDSTFSISSTKTTHRHLQISCHHESQSRNAARNRRNDTSAGPKAADPFSSIPVICNSDGDAFCRIASGLQTLGSRFKEVAASIGVFMLITCTIPWLMCI